MNPYFTKKRKHHDLEADLLSFVSGKTNTPQKPHSASMIAPPASKRLKTENTKDSRLIELNFTTTTSATTNSIGS